MKAKTIVVLVLVVLFLILLIQNTKVVSFYFYFWELSMSRILLFPGILITGFIIGYFTALIRTKKKKSANSDKL
jgi:uncharacterized integral membrane protein